LLDLRLPGGSGLTLLEQVKAMYPETGVVVMTAFATVSSAVEAMRIGAGDYLTKPFALADLRAVIERAGQRVNFHFESRRLREKLRTAKGMGEMIGQSPAMEKLYRILSKVAFSTHPVLILGESGTGKEMVARSIHKNGPNAMRPFVPVDCGSLVATLIESELFGHVKGAFTGAHKAKEGLLVAAGGGTVFLDEIGELPLDLQAKLLRALQEKEVRPVGSTQAVPISARVLAATNRDLAGMVERGQFRKDLYFRLNVVNLRIPPLRDRREDIHALALHCLERLERETGVVRRFSEDALRVMLEYDWPGNVRELENAIERACALSSGPVLHMGDMPTQLQDFRMHRAAQAKDASEADAALDEAALDGVLHGARGGIVSIAVMERDAILGTIRQLKGDKLMAAKLLGIGKTTLYRKLKEYGITEVGEEMN
jgi:two-component system response regulator HydG